MRYLLSDGHFRSVAGALKSIGVSDMLSLGPAPGGNQALQRRNDGPLSHAPIYRCFTHSLARYGPYKTSMRHSITLTATPIAMAKAKKQNELNEQVVHDARIMRTGRAIYETSP